MTGPSATEAVEAWEAEWIAARFDHWGDGINWQTAREIARRLDAARKGQEPVSSDARDGLAEKVRAAIVGCHDDKSEWGKLRIADLIAIEAALSPEPKS